MVHRDLVKEIYLLCTCFSLSLGVEEQVDHSLKAKSFLGNDHPGGHSGQIGNGYFFLPENPKSMLPPV